ncbi:MAG: hypothetical protein JNM27_04200 [Leptospirales bacterium]|nr:hypothetical protein [Leptospirales bacterium]
MMLQSMPPAKIAQLILGSLLLIAGMFLAYKTYERATAVLDQPMNLKPWLELRQLVHPEKKEESRSLLESFKPEVSLIKDEQIHVVGGYLTLFLSVFFLLVIGKLASVFIKAGANLITEALKKNDSPAP